MLMKVKEDYRPFSECRSEYTLPGGDNAGHIVIDGKIYLIPSVFPEKISVIGSGMVVNLISCKS